MLPTIFTNIIYDKNGNEIVFYKDIEDKILAVTISDMIELQAIYSPQPECSSYILLDPPRNAKPSHSVDTDTATAIIAYLWNERQQNALVNGHEDLEYSTISLSYHIILKAISIFDVTIGERLEASYSINLSSSDVRLEELVEQGNISKCTHGHKVQNNKEMQCSLLQHSVSDYSTTLVEKILVPDTPDSVQPQYASYSENSDSQYLVFEDKTSGTNEGVGNLMDYLSGEFPHAKIIGALQYSEHPPGQWHDTNPLALV